MTSHDTSARAGISRRAMLTGAVVAGGVLLGGAVDLARSRFVAADETAPDAVAAPRVYTRAEWGARATSAGQIIAAPDHIVVHHTASDNTTDYSLDQAYALSRWIQDLHIDNGWGDAGQQLTISRGGYVMEGRHNSLPAVESGQNVFGAQCRGHNDHTIGIENEGLYTSQDTTVALFNSLVQTCAWLCVAYNLDPHAAIVGHRDYVSTTECPGDVLYSRLPELRNRVATTIGA